MSTYHVPIMVDRVLELLKPQRGGVFVDGTLGGGGHAEAVLKALPEGSKLIGIDRDKEAIAEASKRLAGYNGFSAVQGNFFDMKRLLAAEGIGAVDGILLDLGVSSHQLDAAQRGFSYNEEAPLDMRMDEGAGLSAWQVVNEYPVNELARVIKEYGEERFARRVAGAIEAARPIETTTHLAEVIKGVIPAAARREGPHPARRSFQAIRIEVNGELEGLADAVQSAHDLLKPGGVLAVITFHSLEDRIVKQAFKTFEHPCTCDPKAPVCTCGKLPTVRILTKKPLIATEDEVQQNPRSRSAKLRAVEKLG